MLTLNLAAALLPLAGAAAVALQRAEMTAAGAATAQPVASKQANTNFGMGETDVGMEHVLQLDCFRLNVNL